MNAEVWLNEHLLTRHPYGFTSFLVDLTPYMDNNCYWNTAGQPVTFAGLTVDQWRTQQKHDQHLIIADPRFVDARSLDFHLRPNSPALKLGFEDARPGVWCGVKPFRRIRTPGFYSYATAGQVVERRENVIGHGKAREGNRGPNR